MGKVYNLELLMSDFDLEIGHRLNEKRMDKVYAGATTKQFVQPQFFLASRHTLEIGFKGAVSLIYFHHLAL